MEIRQTLAKTLVVVGVLIGLYLLFELRSMVLLFFGSILFASTIRPVVLSLERRGVRRPLSILLVYVAVALSVVAVIAILLPALLERFQAFAESLHQIRLSIKNLLEQAQRFTFVQTGILIQLPSPEEFRAYLSQIRTDVQEQLRIVMLNGLSVGSELLVLLVISFYWLTERDRIEGLGLRMLSPVHRERFRVIFNDVEATLGAYVLGQGTVCVTVALFSFVGLSIIGVPSALLLAVIAGITEAIPFIGPIIGAVPAILVALITSPEKAVLTLLLYAIVQGLEANFLVPKIIERRVGLSPLLVILALAAGNILGGILGAVIAIPIMAMLQVLVRHLVIEPAVGVHQPQVGAGGAVLVGRASTAGSGETSEPAGAVPKSL